MRCIVWRLRAPQTTSGASAHAATVRPASTIGIALLRERNAPTSKIPKYRPIATSSTPPSGRSRMHAATHTPHHAHGRKLPVCN